MPLPIEPALPAIRSALRDHRSAVLQAPPGAGKTTRVPLALLDEPWLADRKIVMLEPRRLAARAAAGFMARSIGERVGETVGYRVRMDTRVSARTRVEVVTEGVLTRLVHADPGLEDVGLVIFDEFHERSLHADLGLALTLQTRSVLRDDLRLLVMSATLDGAPVAALLGEGAGTGPAPIVTSEGRAFPVETRYVGRGADRPLEPAIAAVVRRALAEDEGDVLVFLPGAAEIRRVESLLADSRLPPGVYVAPLFGDLAADAQDRAIEPSPPGMRKIVLATSIAETSLTIEGVRVIVDGGLMRVPRFSPRSGMTRLETVRVTRASADQRRGRAGRVAPGVCYRLWSEQEEQQLAHRGRPEILDADLAPLALELAEAGVLDAGELRWLEPPPAAGMAQARELLFQLGALHSDARITEHGRRMARLALHPRLAHMLLAGVEIGHGALACDVAALLSERDILRFESAAAVDADLRLRLDALQDTQRGASPPVPAPGATLDRGPLHRALAISRHLRGQLPRAPHPAPRGPVSAGLLLAFAYPDRIAQRRAARDDARGGAARFLLRNGVGAVLPSPQALAAESYIAVAELGGQQPEARIYLAAPLTLDEIEAHFGDQIERGQDVAWDASAGIVRATERERLGALVLQERRLSSPDREPVAAALLGAITEDGLRSLPWTDAARQIQQRVIFLHRLDPRWPDLSDAALAATLADWLRPHVYGLTRRDELQRLDLASILLGALTWEQRVALDELAPSHVGVPSGSRIRVDYSDPSSPVLAVRLQELFGLTETPRIAGGRVPLTLHLLSPAQRPVQVTTDLAGFWRTGYFDVRKELKGRYPKHYWPDDPLAAEPTRRVRPTK